MPSQTNKKTTKSNKSSPKLRVTRIVRHRSHKIQSTNLTTKDIPYNATTHASVRLSRRTSHRRATIISMNSNEPLRNQSRLINETKTIVSRIPRSQLNQSKMKNYLGKNELQEQQRNNELKKDRIFSTSEMTHFQTNNRSDKTANDGLTNRIIIQTGSSEEFHKQNRKKRKATIECPRGSRLCIFFSILAAISIAIVIVAVSISIVNKTDTTKSTTATTETTTITYVPTGIWALEIPTCATWNQTGVTVAGNANGTAGTDSRSLNATVSIFIDNNYTLYVCDRENHRIMKYEVNATTGTMVAGTGSAGNSSLQLYQPKGVAVDQMNAIIVADSSNYRIQRFPVGSLVGTTVASSSASYILGQTRDLHIDVNNGIYVTDSNYSRIVKFYPNNGVGVTLAGTSGVGSAADQFNTPFGNFIDGNQTLFVADNGNHRVQMWLVGATTGSTVAGITGAAGSSLTQLDTPMGVISDNNGYIYVADYGNNRIVRWTTNYTAGGTCIVGCGGSAGVGATELRNPRDLKFDASGNLYVSDQGNNRVQKYAIQIFNCTASG